MQLYVHNKNIKRSRLFVGILFYLYRRLLFFYFYATLNIIFYMNVNLNCWYVHAWFSAIQFYVGYNFDSEL